MVSLANDRLNDTFLTRQTFALLLGPLQRTTDENAPSITVQSNFTFNSSNK